MEVKVLYDSFNARYLTFNEVADSFISNHFFVELLENNHSLLMGPRGCGKTTLLKMLTPIALANYDKKQSSDYFSKSPFYGIYIPTDVHWKKQLDQLEKDFGKNPFTNAVSRITVNVNILISIIKTFTYLINTLEGIDKESKLSKEIEFSKAVIDHWKLRKPIVPNLDAIEVNLLSIIADLNSEIRKKLYKNEHEAAIEEYLYFEYFQLGKIAFTTFQNIFKELPQKKMGVLLR